MKCEYCGNNLQIEDRVCPFCGKPNPFAKQHQKEMDRFSRKFEKTRADVLKESARFNRKTVRITILSVLVALCAVFALLCARADDIRYDRQEKAIEQDAPQIRKTIDEMMEAGDPCMLYRYVSVNRYSYSDALREYDAVISVSLYYDRFYENLMMLNAKKQDPSRYTYTTAAELLEGIAASVRRIHESMQENKYHPEMHSAEKKAYMERVCDTVRVMLTGYLHLTDEEAGQIFELSEARLNVMLEEAYER